MCDWKSQGKGQQLHNIYQHHCKSHLTFDFSSKLLMCAMCSTIWHISREQDKNMNMKQAIIMFISHPLN